MIKYLIFIRNLSLFQLEIYISIKNRNIILCYNIFAYNWN